MKFFGIKNNSSREAFPCEPCEFKPNVPASIGTDNIKYKQWRAHPKTEHLIYSVAEGLNPDIRASKENPVKRLYGLIADYDAPANEAICGSLLERLQKLKLPVEYWPKWISRTFSDGVRLVWEFEEPIALDEGVIAKAFMKRAYEDLVPDKLFPGLDRPTWDKLAKLYDVGRSWEKLGDQRIGTNALQYWLFEGAKRARLSDLGEVNIPIDIVGEQVEKHFPGRWTGPFEVGARGVTFFDPSSENPTSAIVTEVGMICFNQDQVFHSWAKIFGGGFVRKFQQDRIGNATRDTWFDGKSYFQKLNGVWMAVAKDDYAKWLNVRCGLSKIAKDDNPSEVNDAEVFVQRERRVAGVIPRVYDEKDIIEMNGLRFLNCSYVKPLVPYDTKVEWGEGFPWLAGFFIARLCDLERAFFFGWLQRFYGSALQMDLKKGHALFPVGGVNLGKTLLSNKIIGGLLGGFSDASAYVTKGSEFNKQLLELGLWVIDDGEVAADAQAHRKFSEVVKRVVANPAMTYRAMFRDAQTTTWNGRLVVTLNDDTHSLAMIPDLETSMEEKVMVIHILDTPYDIPKNVESIILAELPYFARWLLDWPLPSEIIGDARLGIKHYINEELRDKALNASGVADVLDIKRLWQNRMNPWDKYGAEWVGSGTEWVAECEGDDTVRRMVGRYTIQQLSRKLIQASRIKGSGISVLPGNGGTRFKILLKPPSKSPTSEKKTSVSFKEESLAPVSSE